jgi:hypothetical protein
MPNVNPTLKQALTPVRGLRIRPLVAIGHKNYQCTADFENLGDYFLFLGKLLYGPFCGGLDFFDPYIVPRCARDNLEGQKSPGPLKISLKMAHKVICPQKNNLPHFQNQEYINSSVDPAL